MKSEDGNLPVNAVGKPEAALITARELKNADGRINDFMIEFINDPALNILNKAKTELLYQPFSLVFSPYCKPDFLNTMIEVFNSGIQTEIQIECINMALSENGKSFYHITISKAGEELNLIFKRLDKEMYDSSIPDINFNTKLIFDNIPIGAYLTTSDGRILMANQVLVSMLGYESLNELSKRNLEKEGYEDISHTREEFKNTIDEHGEIKGFESVWMKKNGDVIYIRENARIIGEKNGIKFYEGTVEDISDLKRAEIKLTNSESLINSIIDSLSCHLAVIDSSGEIIKVNHAWELFAAENNATTNVSVGANYLKACEDSDLQDARNALDGILQVLNGKSAEFSMEYSCHSPQKKRWFMMTVKPLQERKGASICHTNITENILSRERLEEMMSRLGRSNEELQQFAYIASHDLQEPLRMITSYINIIKKYNSGWLDADTERYFGFVQDGAERMKDLTRDLLEYSRVSTGTKELKSVDLKEIIKIVESDCHTTIENSKAVIKAYDLPVVIADEIQMRQLFQNLISNAIKFRGSEDPVIKIYAVKEKTAWRISISDNGIGIEEKDREKVFNIFQRLHDRSLYPGTGIGLSVCKKIVERHNGRIWIDSEPGKGTTFHFTIPIR
ncbi:MAG: ATP-binding protein [Syntrophothermus sp.]